MKPQLTKAKIEAIALITTPDPLVYDRNIPRLAIALITPRSSEF